MMKVLKNILLIVVLILTTSFIPTNVSDVRTDVIIPIEDSYSYDMVTYIGWTPSGIGYWTQGNYYSIYNDFDWMVTRSSKPINGYYYFDFWFYSQSYYWDGYTAEYSYTNIRNINVYVDGSHYCSDYSSLGISFFDTYNAKGLRIITKNPQPRIYFKWDYMKAK